EVVRIAGGVELGPFTLQYVHVCLDGQVTVTFLFGEMIGPFTSRLFRWMHEEGACDESLATKDWIGLFGHVIGGTEAPSGPARRRRLAPRRRPTAGRPGLGRREGSGLHVGLRWSLCDAHPGRPRRDGRQDRDLTQDRGTPRRGALERPFAERGLVIAVPLAE